jgi:hypothetical protein
MYTSILRELRSRDLGRIGALAALGACCCYLAGAWLLNTMMLASVEPYWVYLWWRALSFWANFGLAAYGLVAWGGFFAATVSAYREADRGNASGGWRRLAWLAVATLALAAVPLLARSGWLPTAILTF